MSVAVVIVNYRTPVLTARCLDSLLIEHRSIPGMGVVVVDGGSADGSAEYLERLIARRPFRTWAKFIPLDLNGGFGFANNVALVSLLQEPSSPEFVMLLNPDTVVEQGAIASLVNYLRANPDVGAVGSQLLEESGTPTGCAFPFPTVRGEIARAARTKLIYRLLRVSPDSFPPAEHAHEADWVTGASVMFRTAALRESGIFDDGFFLYHEEIELMWRMRRAGWKICHEPQSRVRHVGGAATGVHSRPTPGVTSPRRPRYWYQSRRRYFFLTRGRWVAIGAVLGWILGYSIISLRRWLRLARGGQVEREFSDGIRYGFPWRAETASSSIRWNVPRTHPLWMMSGA